MLVASRGAGTGAAEVIRQGGLASDSGRHLSEALQLSAEPYPGLGAVAVDFRLRLRWVLSRSANPQLLQGFAPRGRSWPGPIASSTSTHPLPPRGSPPADRRD